MKIDFAKRSSIRIGGAVEVETIDDRGFNADGFFIVGCASNLLVSPDTSARLAILGREFDFCRAEGLELIAGGACKNGRVLSLCKRLDLGGLEFLAGLPGTIGGLVAMNAGLKGFSAFDRLEWIDFGGDRVAASEIARGYRRAEIRGVVFAAGFRLQRGFDRALEAEFLAIRAKHPKEPSAGSCFKNPEGDYAGRLIEAVGLKGSSVGGAAFSEKHANFLINCGGAAFSDAISLIDLAKTRVLDAFGVAIETEIKIV